MGNAIASILAYGVIILLIIGIIGLLLPFILFGIGFFGVVFVFGMIGAWLNN